ncbi:tetratricopeptide repeat-containing glycosyltransferase [Granulosicoccus sp. 3-233]
MSTEWLGTNSAVRSSGQTENELHDDTDTAAHRQVFDCAFENGMISAVLIVKDEARVLQHTLETLREVVDEIVVADTGSRDETMTIAESIADVVCSIPWQQDFASARNQALEKASGDWVLSIDADEVVREPAAARQLLIDFVNQHSSQTSGSVEVVSATCQHGQRSSVRSHMQRFFHRASVRFEGAMHEQLVPLEGHLTTACTQLIVDHSGYAHEPDDPDHKARRNIPLLQSLLLQQPDNEYYRFQLGQSCFTVDQHDDAARELTTMLNGLDYSESDTPTGHAGPVAREVLTTAIVSLAYAQVNRHRLDEARALLDQHRNMAHGGTRWADFQHVCGHVGFMQGDIDYAKAGYQAALELGVACEDVDGTGSYASSYHLGLLAEVEGAPLTAIDHYTRALTARADYDPALDRLVDCLVENRLDQAFAARDIADPAPWREKLHYKRRHYQKAGDASSVAIIDYLLTSTDSLPLSSGGNVADAA